MGKSVWTLLLIGFMTVIALVLGMLMTLTQLEGTPAWMQTKLALAIKSEFDFLGVGTEQVTDGPRTILRVQYEAKPGKAAFSKDLATAEMEKVGQFAATKFDSKEKVNIDSIELQRRETHGRGCFQNTYTAKHSMANPVRTAAPQTPADRIPSVFR